MSIQTIIPVDQINLTRLRGGEKFRCKNGTVVIYERRSTSIGRFPYPLTFRYEHTTTQGSLPATYTERGWYNSFAGSPRDLEGLIVSTDAYDYLLKRRQVDAVLAPESPEPAPSARPTQPLRNAPVSIEGLKVGSKVRLHNDDVLTLVEITSPDNEYNYVFKDESGGTETYTPEGFFYLSDRTSSLNVAEIISRATDVVRLDDVKVGDRLHLRDNQIRKVSTIFENPDGKKVPYAEGFFYDLSGKINFMARRPNEDHHADVLEILPPEPVDLSKFDLKPGIKAVTRDGRLLAYKGVYDNSRRLTEWRCNTPSENRLYFQDGQRYTRDTQDDIVEVLTPLNPNANV